MYTDFRPQCIFYCITGACFISSLLCNRFILGSFRFIIFQVRVSSFQVVHNIDGASDVAINHPNQYFDESQKHLGAKENHDAGSKGKVVKVAGSKIKREDKSNEEDWDGMDDSELSQIDLNSFSEDT